MATARSQWSGGIEFSPASYKLYEGVETASSQVHLAISALALFSLMSRHTGGEAGGVVGGVTGGQHRCKGWSVLPAHRAKRLE